MKSKRPLPSNNYPLFEEEAAAPLEKSASRNKRDARIPEDLDSAQYEIADDGLLREIVGPWVRDKHAILERYVTIASAVRKRWVQRGPAGTTYIDLFCGPGEVRIKSSGEVLPGSPALACQCAQQRGAPFTEVFVSDAHAAILGVCRTRLSNIGVAAKWERGEAVTTVDQAAANLNPYSYHFAFLDPFNLGALSFDIIRRLARLRHIDILIHVSAQDLNRNLRKYIAKHGSSLDTFAPGWRNHVDTSRSDGHVRAKIFEYWRGLLRSVGLPVAEATELVSGEGNQPLYWLAFAAKAPKAHEFWDKIRTGKDDGRQSTIKL